MGASVSPGRTANRSISVAASARSRRGLIQRRAGRPSRRGLARKFSRTVSSAGAALLLSGCWCTRPTPGSTAAATDPGRYGPAVEQGRDRRGGAGRRRGRGPGPCARRPVRPTMPRTSPARSSRLTGPVPRCPDAGEGQVRLAPAAGAGRGGGPSCLGRRCRARGGRGRGRRAALADEEAVAQDREAVGDLVHLVEPVADVDDGVASVAQGVQDVEEPGAVRGREAGGRLVEDDELRPCGQCAGDGDQGALGAGRGRRPACRGRDVRRRCPAPRRSARGSAARRSVRRGADSRRPGRCSRRPSSTRPGRGPGG